MPRCAVGSCVELQIEIQAFSALRLQLCNWQFQSLGFRGLGLRFKFRGLGSFGSRVWIILPVACSQTFCQTL